MNPTMTASNLQVLRHYNGDGNLQRVVKPSAAQELIFKTTGGTGIPAGRCCSLNASGEAELGVTGRRVPMWLWRSTDKPSGGWSGDPVSVAPGLTWADGSKHLFLFFVGVEGLEIATTEYIAGQTYAYNTLVSARMSNNSAYSTDTERAAGAGKVYSTGVLHGAHPVVGVVSVPPGSYGVSIEGIKRFGSDYLVLYTLYRPPVEGILNGTPTNSTAP